MQAIWLIGIGGSTTAIYSISYIWLVVRTATKYAPQSKVISKIFLYIHATYSCVIVARRWIIWNVSLKRTILLLLFFIEISTVRDKLVCIICKTKSFGRDMVIYMYNFKEFTFCNLIYYSKGEKEKMRIFVQLFKFYLALCNMVYTFINTIK